ncbi:hypothetical protein BDR07DRAFT_1405335 [Suillus spraguei]|nr:hypothetical protein BDR07DRAFT_1405335 [Suillus spraguei]
MVSEGRAAQTHCHVRHQFIHWSRRVLPNMERLLENCIPRRALPSSWRYCLDSSRRKSKLLHRSLAQAFTYRPARNSRVHLMMISIMAQSLKIRLYISVSALIMLVHVVSSVCIQLPSTPKRDDPEWSI